MPGGGVPMAVIILGVFKWIGIILLCILGLMLLLCLAVLLIPIRYQLSAVWQEEHRVKGSVSWLLHLIHLSFDTDRNQRVCIRIFGIPVNGRFHTKKKKFQKRRKVKQKRKASGLSIVQLKNVRKRFSTTARFGRLLEFLLCEFLLRLSELWTTT